MKQTEHGRRYNSAFKQQAVELLLSSDKTLNQVATELGVGFETLNRWKKQYLRDQSVHREGKRITAADLEREVQRLRAENEHLRRQRDILKKSLGILSEEPLQKGMPK